MNKTANLLVLMLVTVGHLQSYSLNTVGRTSCRVGRYLAKTHIPTLVNTRTQNTKTINPIVVLRQVSSSGSDIDDETEIHFARTTSKTVDKEETIIAEKKDDDTVIEVGGGVAATNTINERLLAELQEAERKERFGPKSALGKKLGLLDGYGRTRKSDEENKAAIAEARDLNGVNPLIAIGGSFFAFGVAAVLWLATNKLGVYFAVHTPETEVYFVLRTAQVFRNVVMGSISLASGFFGVTGLGIFGMGVRVAYGVMAGELDPTPIKQRTTKAKETVDMSNMLDLMMNKKPGRRGGGKK